MAEFDAAAVRSLQPVGVLPEKAPEDGIGLCLSGGGYRAMLFHLGALWRLNERGLLRRLDRVSSVSGGSITAATLGLRWRGLEWRRRRARGQLRARWSSGRCARWRARRSTSRRCSRGSLPFATVGERVADAYREHLFGERDPAGPARGGAGPRFVICATNLESGVLCSASRGRTSADYRVGMIDDPRDRARRRGRGLVGVPAGPLAVRARPAERRVGDRGAATTSSSRRGAARSSSPTAASTTTSGSRRSGSACRTVLISDGGGQAPDDADPPADWPRQVLRVLKVIDNQVRELRKRQAVGQLQARAADRHLLGDPLRVADYGLDDALAVRRRAWRASWRRRRRG